MKKILTGFLIGLGCIALSASAASVLQYYQGGTGLGTYDHGDLMYFSSSTQTFARIATSTDGYVLTLSGNIPTWAAAAAGGGGGGFTAWTTTTNGSLVIYPDNTTDHVVIGGNATTTDGFIFEVIGSSVFDAITSSGYITATGFTGNASTASALAANPSDCGAGEVAYEIDASGNLTCYATSTWDTDTTYTGGDHITLTDTSFAVDDDFLSNSGDTGTDYTFDDLILNFGISSATATITTVTGDLTGNADTATALAADPADCAAGYYALGIDANGSSTCSIDTTGSGGGEVSAWATTTDGIELIYPEATSSDLLLGNSATGTANFWFDTSEAILSLGINDTATGTLYLYGSAADMGGILRFYNPQDGDDTEEWWQFTADGDTSFNLGVDGSLTAFQFYNSGNLTAAGNLAGATYASDASVSDTELKYINSLSSNAQTQFANILDGTTAFTGINLGNDLITDAYLDWGNFTDLSAGGSVDWGNVAAGELGNDSIINEDIDDDGNFVFTGGWDFGGGVIEITNANDPTVDGAGEIAVRTASDTLIYYGAAERVINYEFDKSFVIASTTIDKDSNSFESGTATGTWTLWNPSDGVTLTQLYCKTDTGTVILACGDGTNKTESIVCTSSGVADDGSIANGTFTQRENFTCEVGSAATSPLSVTITGTFAWTAQ